MEITLAADNDKAAILKLIHECIKDMDSKGIFQWNHRYPDLDIVSEDVDKRTLFLRKNEIDYLGIITINEEQPPEYKTIEWITNKEKALIIHRLAVNPKWQDRGIANMLMDFAEDYAEKNNYVSIRLDAYSGNQKALKLYEKRGYKRVGQTYFPMRELPFYCYEKLIQAK